LPLPDSEQVTRGQPALVRGGVEAHVESYQVDTIRRAPSEQRPEVGGRTSEVLQLVHDEASRNSFAKLLEGVREPRSLERIRLWRAVIPDHVRERPPPLAASSLESRRLTLEVCFAVSLRVAEHSRRLLGGRRRRPVGGRRCPTIGATLRPR
jgi:hypothetical protein